MTSSPNEGGGAPVQTGAVRLIFEYDGDDVRLVSQQRVDVAVTGFDLQTARAPGHYVETRDADGTALTNVRARAAFLRSAEVFPDVPGEPIVRTELDRPSGAFTVVVPARPDAVEVAVVEVEHLPEGAGPEVAALPPRRDLATFALESQS